MPWGLVGEVVILCEGEEIAGTTAVIINQQTFYELLLILYISEITSQSVAP
jgi:hypothetical protein